MTAADAAADAPPATSPAPVRRLYAATALSAGLSFASFHPLDVGLLAYVALVPVLFAAATASRRAAITIAFLSTVLFHVVGLAWIATVTPEGWLFTSFLEGFYGVALVCLPLWFRRRTGVPLLIGLAVLGPGLEWLRGNCYFIGFPWLFWGHTQHARSTLIQIADVTSVYGVSSLVLMVNGALVDALLLLRDRAGRAQLDPLGRAGQAWSSSEQLSTSFSRWWGALTTDLPSLAAALSAVERRRLAVYAAAPAGLVLLALLYGVVRVWHVEANLTPGPRLLVVQCDIPQSLKDAPTAADTLARANLNLTQAGIRASGGRFDAIVWSETMWPWPIPDRRTAAGRAGWDRWFAETVEGTWGRGAAHVVGNLTRDLLNVPTHHDAPLLVGAVDRGLDGGPEHNSYYAIAPDPPRQAKVVARYDKIELVPVSEFIPFKGVAGMNWFFDFFKSLVPPGFVVFAPGEGPVLMDAGAFRLAPNICFEISFPELLRRSTALGADVHVCPANDGWFVRGNPLRGEVAKPTAEIPLSRAHTRFRAIENRRSVVRCVNRGISLVCDPTGAFTAEVEHSLPGGTPGVGVSTWLTVEPPDCELRSLYVRFGDVYPLLCLALSLAGLGVVARGRRAAAEA